MICSMLASSVSWYLPVLFLSCLAWAFAFSLEGALRERHFVLRLYRWTPPLMVAGLVVTRAFDILSLSSLNPEVALTLDQGASISEKTRLLFTGQGALEGALFAFLGFALFAPNLPSLRGCSPETSDFVRSRMMTHAGVWAVMLLMLLFQQDMYASPENAPQRPTVDIANWSAFFLVVLFTLLLMMSGEILTATAHLATSGETSLLFQRAILKMLLAGVVAWACLFQTEVFTSTWWDRPWRDERLAVGLMIATYGTWVALPHAFSTVAESLKTPGSSQAKDLGWCFSFVAMVLLFVAGMMADALHIYGEGSEAFIAAWKGVALLLFFGALSMLLPTVGFDAAHHPEAWWFRATLLLGPPLGVLMSDAAWLLYPAVLLAGGSVILVSINLQDRTSMRERRFLLLGMAAWLVCCSLLLTSDNPRHMLQFALLAVASVSGFGAVWLRRQNLTVAQK